MMSKLYHKNYFIAFAILMGTIISHIILSRPGIPKHLTGHRADFYPDMIDEKTHKELLEIIKKLKIFPTNANDLAFYNTTYVSIGEDEPFDPDFGCKSSYLVPNVARTKCILPCRFDLAKHFMTFGGVDGLRENFELLATRMQSFGRYIFDPSNYPAMEKLFYSKKFVAAAKKICPPNKPVLDPFQFHLIIQIPGQVLPVHLDAVIFEHATRFQYPTWLPVVMLGAGLHLDKFIDQVQGVAYLHTWNSSDLGGHLAYYPKNSNKPIYQVPYPRSVELMDGSKTMHGSSVFRPRDHIPILPKSAKNELLYTEENDIWELRSDGQVLKRYRTDDFRISLVYRSRCFESEEKRQEFAEWVKSGKDVIPIEDVLNELKDELSKQFGYKRENLDKISRIDLAWVLVHKFLRYPLPEKFIIPWNLCNLPVILPMSKPVVDLFCR